MNNEMIEIILAGTLEIAFIGGMILYVLQITQDMKNNELKTRKKLELLDTKILAIKHNMRQ